MRVAVTGAGGRLGRALIAALADAPFTGLAGPIAWTRPDYDLDDPGRGSPARRARSTGGRRPRGGLDRRRRLRARPGPGPPPERGRDRRAGRRPVRRAGVDLVVVSTNEVFDGQRTDGRGYRPTTRPAPPTRTARASSPASWRRRDGVRRAGRRSGAGDRPDGLAVRAARATTSRPRSSRPRSGPGRRRAAPGRRRRIRLADVHRGPGRGDRRAHRLRRDRRDPPLRQPRRRSRARLGARGAPPGPGRRRHRGGPRVDLDPCLDAATLGGPRVEPARRPASRCGRGPRRWPTTPRLSAPGRVGAGRRARPGAGRDRPARSPSSLPGVRYGAVVRHADARGSFRELWRASAYPAAGSGAALAGVDGARFVQANLSTSAAGVLRGLHYHRRQLDRWVVASGRAFVALVDVRPVAAGSGPAVGRDPRPRCRRLGRDPGRRRPRLPRPRAARAGLPRHRRVRRQRRATASPGTTRPSACPGRCRSPAPSTVDRSCPSATGRTRRWPSSWRGCAPG